MFTFSVLFNFIIIIEDYVVDFASMLLLKPCMHAWEDL